MSLVNEVLRDLDRRKRSTGVQQQRMAAILTSGGERRRTRVAVVVGIAVAGVLIGLAAGFLYFRPGADIRDTPAPLVQPAMAAVPQAEPVTAAAPEPAPVQPATTPSAPVELLDVVYEEEARGFRLRLPASDLPDFDVTARSGYGINVLVRGAVLAEDFPAARVGGVDGLSLYSVRDGLNLNLELARGAEFDVYARSGTGGEELVIEAVLAPPPAPVTAESAAALSPPPAATPTPPAPAAVTATVSNTPYAPASSTSAPAPDAGREVRTTRELSFAERDRGTGQAGARLVQRGQLLEAYDLLLSFIEQNPEAHVSRETLATILLAQQEYTQAARLVNDGLALAPNYAPYKKLQARLLIREGNAAQALALLQQAPPALESDPEYFDLMASLRQQTGDHAGAIAGYQLLLARDPAHARWWAAMAISLEAVGRKRDAQASYERALQSQDLDIDVRRYSQNRLEALRLQP